MTTGEPGPSRRTTLRRRTVGIASATGLVVALAGCDGSGATEAATERCAGGASCATTDSKPACDLLSLADARRILGPGASKPPLGGPSTSCTYVETSTAPTTTPSGRSVPPSVALQVVTTTQAPPAPGGPMQVSTVPLTGLPAGTRWATPDFGGGGASFLVWTKGHLVHVDVGGTSDDAGNARAVALRVARRL